MDDIRSEVVLNLESVIEYRVQPYVDMLHTLLRGNWEYSEDDPEGFLRYGDIHGRAFATSGGYVAIVYYPDGTSDEFIPDDLSSSGQEKVQYWIESKIIEHCCCKNNTFCN